MSCESVHLTFPPRTFLSKESHGACYIAGHWGPVQNKMKETYLTPIETLSLNLLLSSIVFHNKICVFIMIFTAYARLIYYMLCYAMYSLF